MSAIGFANTSSSLEGLGWRAATLAAQRRPGFTLPQPFYLDPELFEWDLERVFFRNWLLAGHVSQIQEAGKYFLYEIGGDSIIVARGRDGQIHANFNVCRHRGSRVCAQAEGQANSLVCPYHSWTYGLDGRLLGAAGMPDDFDRAQYGLRRCRVDVLNGMIYLHLADDDPPDWRSLAAEVEPFLRPHHLADARLAVRQTWEIRANWKLVVENFAECYHCRSAHPEYCSIMGHTRADATRAAADLAVWAEETAAWEQHTRALGYPTGNLPGAVDRLHTAGRMPVGGGKLSPSRSGALLAPLMGDFRESDGGYTFLRIYPASYFLASCDHVVLCRFTPLAVDRTIQEMLWLVNPQAVAGRDYDVDELTWLWRVTTEQDLRIIEDNQAGVASRAYQPGPYSAAERSTDQFVQWYLSQIALPS